MRGLHLNVRGEENKELELLARRPGIELMRQTLVPGATAWISPSTDRETFEFFYVLSGSVRLLLEEGSKVLRTGESFYVQWLEDSIQIEVIEITELLYLSNQPLFDSLQSYQDNLRNLLIKINEKDDSTYRHSRNVMYYSALIAKRLDRNKRDIDDLVNAALFHDIGKCFIPDEILKKPDKLSDEEYFIMKKHPIDSAHLIKPIFGQHAADIAGSHHEKLDGSGYPFGLKRDEISMEGRIIAVADSFDAMTTKRIYNKEVKSKAAAVEELCKMKDKYDQIVCEALRDLFEKGELDTIPENYFE